MADIILASQSPRRAELLAAMGVNYKVIPSEYDEKLDDTRSPVEVAKELALSKALKVAEKYPSSIVIGSDTIVTIGGKQLDKPKDEGEAFQALTMLAGETSEVTTGLAVVCLEKGARYIGADTTQVIFKPFNKNAVQLYVATGDPMDKAGSYGIQSGAAPLIDYIVGRYDTVVGLPTKLLAEFLVKLGINSKELVLESPVPRRAKY